MEKTKQSQNGKMLKVVIGVVAFALSYYVVGQLFKTDLEEELKKAARELNTETPIQLDKFTRLDSASTLGKTNFIYHYTLLKIEKSQINTDTFRKYMTPNMVQTLKTNLELKGFRDNNIIMNYKYYTKEGDSITEIVVTPDMYK